MPTFDAARRTLFSASGGVFALVWCSSAALSLQGCFSEDYQIEERSAVSPTSSDALAVDASSPNTSTSPSTSSPEGDEPSDPIVMGSTTSSPTPAPTLIDGDEQDDRESDAGAVAPPSPPSKPAPSTVDIADAGAPSSDDVTTPPVSTELPPVPPCTRYSTYEDPQPFRGLGLDGLNIWSPSLSADRLELFVAASTPDDEMLYVAHRSSPDDDFSPAEPVTELNTDEGREGTPALSADGLTLAFYSTRDSESRDLWIATRPSRSKPFGEPMALDDLNTSDREHLPWLSADGLTLLYTSDTDPSVGGRDIWIAARSALDEPFIGGTPLANVNSPLNDDRAALNATGLILYFSSERDAEGDFDMYYASREDLDADFGTPTRLLTQNSPNQEVDVTLARDNLELIYVSDSSGENQVFHAFRTCLE